MRTNIADCVARMGFVFIVQMIEELRLRMYHVKLIVINCYNFLYSIRRINLF